MTLLILVEKEVPFLKNDLIGAPFLLILTITALLGDYISVIVAIIVGVFGIGLISVTGNHLDSVTIRRSVEFLVGGVVIFILSSRSRSLAKTHYTLEETINQLESVTKKLNSEVKLKKKDVLKLTKINQDLRDIIDGVMHNKTLWEHNVKNSIKQQEEKNSKL
jgi:hypothetical protein